MYSLYHISIDPDLNTGYIGITCNPQARFIQHGYLKNKSNAHLKNALQKYGKDVFKRIVISNLDKEAAELIEEMLRPEPNIGWNITKGGGIPPSPKGKERSVQYRANISKSKMGVNNPMYGKKVTMSDIHKLKLSESAKAMPLVTCMHCQYQGRGNAMKRWHFNRCKNAG